MLRFYLTIFIFFICLNNIFAINKSVTDSLWNLYLITKSDTQKVNLLIKLFQEKNNNSINNYDYLDEAIKLSLKKNFKKGLVQAYDLKGVYYRNKSLNKEALDYHHKALDIANDINDTISKCIILNNLSVVYRRIDDYEKAINCLVESLKLLAITNDRKTESFAFNSLGNIYLGLNDQKKAIEYFYKALNYQLLINNSRGLAINYSNLGSAYESLNLLDSAEYFYELALKKNIDAKITKGIGLSQNNLGNLFLMQKNYNFAIEYFKLAEKNLLETDDKYIISDNYLDFAEAYYQKNNFQLAKFYLNKAIANANLINSKSLLQKSYEILAKISFNNNNFKDAYLYQSKSNLYKDSIFNETNQDKINKLQIQYEDHQKTQRIDFLQKEKEQDNKLINLFYALFITGFISLLLIVFIFISRIKSKQKINSILEQKNNEINKVNNELKEQNNLINKQKIELGKLIIDLKSSEEKYKAIFDNSTIGLYRTTPNGKILLANKALIEMLGFDSFESLKALNLQEENPYIDINREKIINELITNGNILGLESKWKKLDGNEVYIRESATLIRNEFDGENYIEGVVEDITQSKNFEIALIQSEKKLKEALSAKDKFFSIIAHDLKNPLQSLILLSETMYYYNDKFSKEQLKEYTEKINKTSKHITSLLDNLLQWARSQTGVIQFNLTKNNLENDINDVLSLLENNINNKSLSLTKEIFYLEDFYYDKYMISTVIRNLISNAIKFTNNNGNINITAKEIHYDLNQYIQISISDSGVGMSNESVEKLFKIDSTFSTAGTNNEKGTGLGLILCKEFIEKHNGRIWVESELNLGSTFYFIIPLIYQINL